MLIVNSCDYEFEQSVCVCVCAHAGACTCVCICLFFIVFAEAWGSVHRDETKNIIWQKRTKYAFEETHHWEMLIHLSGWTAGHYMHSTYC